MANKTDQVQYDMNIFSNVDLHVSNTFNRKSLNYFYFLFGKDSIIKCYEMYAAYEFEIYSNQNEMVKGMMIF